MKNNIVDDFITNILKDDEVIRPNIIYSYNKNEIEILFIENSEYYEYFINENITHKYLFNHKGKKHLLLLNQNSYNKFKSLYSEITIVSTLRLFINRRKRRNLLRFISFSLIMLIALLNLFILNIYSFNKVFYLPLLSIIAVVILYIYPSKLMDYLYLKDKEKTKEKLEELYPNLEYENKNDILNK